MNSPIAFLRFFLLFPLIISCARPIPNSAIVGQSSLFLIETVGVPNREIAVDNGYRWDYSRGPDGLNTYFVYLDNDRKVIRVEQALTEKNFNRISSGMTTEDVIMMIGDPPKRHNIGRDRGYIWSYRSFSTMCIWFQVEFTLDGFVRSVGYNRRPSGIPCR